MFREFLSANREAIVARAKVGIAARSGEGDGTACAARLLDQLVAALDPAPGNVESRGAAAARHGSERCRAGAPIARLVHEYGDVARAAVELAEEQGADVAPAELRLFLDGLDAAVAAAVTGHQRSRDRSQDEERATRLRLFSHELRNKLYSATLAYSVLKGRLAGEQDGELTAIFDRNLAGLVSFIDGSLAELRDERGQRERTRIPVADVIEEVALELAAEAAKRRLQFIVAPLPPGLAVEADWPVLADTLGRLLRSAFRCSREEGCVVLRATEAGERVLIELEDECGGFASGSAHAVLATVATKAIGPGTTAGRLAIEAFGGDLDVRDLPGKGCVVSLSLPRAMDA